MGYRGKTNGIDCSKGGLNGNPNFDTLPPEAMIEGSRNINLNHNGRGKRGGTAHVNDAAFTDTPQVMGLFDFRLRNANQFIMAALKDGKVYKNASTTIKTGMSTSNFFSFAKLYDGSDNELLFICDGATLPQTWNGVGAGTSDLTGVPTDWTGSNYPQTMIKHGRGNSEQLWAIGFSSTPHNVYVSKNNDGDDFSDGEVATIAIETGDGFGIIGGIEFGDRLICFGKTKAFIIDDTDSSRANWGYEAAQWEGGIANFRLVCKTPNDIIAMMEDGEIYSVRSAQTYGDYMAASLIRPAFIHKWMENNVNLAQISKFHMVYDRNLRAVRIFCASGGSSNIDQCLLYFIDRSVEEAWMIHNNISYASGFDASAATEIRVSTGVYKIYTGDYSGEIWKLEENTSNDEGNPYYGGFESPPSGFGDMRSTKKFRRGIAVLQPQGNYAFNITTKIDRGITISNSLNQQGDGAVLDAFVLGQDVLGGDEYLDKFFDIGNIGRRISINAYNSGVNQTFFVSSIILDGKTLSKRPS